MNTRQLGGISILAVAVAALGACATEEVNQDAQATSVSGTKAAPGGRTAGGVSSATQRPGQPGAGQNPYGRAAAGAPDKRSVYYDFDRSDVKPEFRPVVEANAKYLSNSRDMITIEGNTDERGSREYNLALGQRRAESVKSLLKLLGVPETRMETVSYGEEKPAAAGHDDSGWAKNRRSDIVYKKR